MTPPTPKVLSHATTHVTEREPHPNAFMQVPAGTAVTAHWPPLADTPKVLTEADLAGLPRAVSSEEARQKIDKAWRVVSSLCDGTQRWTMSVPARLDSDPDLVIGDALRCARDLVSERDALAGRVAELEADARRYEWLKERLLGADFAWGDPATCVWVFETDAPISADLDESIDDALSATTPESKP